MRTRSLAASCLLLLGAASATSPVVSATVAPSGSAAERPFTVAADINDLDMRMESLVLQSKHIVPPLQVDVSWIAGMEKVSDLPVVYLTDGHWRRVDHKYVHHLAARKLIPPVLVVGIGYPAGIDPQSNRARDLYRSPDPFLQAILEEVIPLVEKRFRCSPDRRILFGASMGGYFSLYALRRSVLAASPWFHGYIAASSYMAESALSVGELRGREVPARLYLSYGRHEARGGFAGIIVPNAELFDALDRARLPKLDYVHHVYPDTDHYTNTRPTLVDGVRLLLGTDEARGVGFTDLSQESVQYDFRAAVQVYDWEPVGALRAVALAGTGAPGLDASSGSLWVAADFANGTSGRVNTTFDHFEDLAENELVFHLFVPEDLAKLGYVARFFLSSTYQWTEDLGAPVRLEKPGWNRLVFTWKGKETSGDPTLARAVGIVIRRPEGAPAWKGDLYFDEISW